MKNLFNAFKLFAIAIAMLGFGNRAMGQTTQINDGGTSNLTGSASPYNSLTITSGTQANASTATLGTVLPAPGSPLKTVTIGNGSDLTGYYGEIQVANGMTLDIQSEVAKIIHAKFSIGGTNAATTLKLTSTATGLCFSGLDLGGFERTITMNDYGILDLSSSTKDITLSGSLYMNGYETYAPQVRWAPTGSLSTNLPKIVISGDGKSFSSSAAGSAIYASKHLSIDLTNATASSLSQTAYPIVQLTNNASSFPLNGSDLVPTVAGNTDGTWIVGDITTTTPSGTTRNLNVVLTFSPLFTLNTGGYARDFGTMHTNATDGIGNVQTLNKTKTSGLGDNSLTKNICIDLQNYTLGGASQKITITNGISFALKHGSGVFDGQIDFMDGTSRLVWLGTGVTDAILGTNFSGSSSSSSGSLQIGDGSNVASATISLASTKITTANKFSNIVVSNNAVLTIVQSNPD